MKTVEKINPSDCSIAVKYGWKLGQFLKLLIDLNIPVEPEKRSLEDWNRLNFALEKGVNWLQDWLNDPPFYPGQFVEVLGTWHGNKWIPGFRYISVSDYCDKVVIQCPETLGYGYSLCDPRLLRTKESEEIMNDCLRFASVASSENSLNTWADLVQVFKVIFDGREALKKQLWTKLSPSDRRAIKGVT